MAEAFFNSRTKGGVQAISAGTNPGAQVDPTVGQVMREVGIDISGRKPKLLTAQMLEEGSRVITMGCGVEADLCPAGFVPAEDWGIEDPHGKPVERVRQIRDEIRAKVDALVRDIQLYGVNKVLRGGEEHVP